MTPSYALGLFFIFLVSIIWAAASIVVQHLYRDMDFDSPFLLTYVSTSLFILFLPTRLLWERRKKISHWVCLTFTSNGSSEYRAVEVDDDCQEDGLDKEEDQIIPWRNVHNVVLAQEELPDATPTITGQDSNSLSGTVEMTAADETPGGKDTATYQRAGVSACIETETENNENDGGGGDGAEFRDHHLGESSPRECDDDAAKPMSPYCANEGPSYGKCRAMESLHTAETSASTFSVETDGPDVASTPGPHLLSHFDHIHMALRIGPVWFLSNYFYNTSLAYTSISSSTVLASTGSLFTFLFAVTCGDEKVNASKLAGVTLCFLGSVLTGLSDAEAAGEDEGSSLVNATYIEKPTASLDDDAGGDATSLLTGLRGDNHSGSQLLGDLAGLISAIGYGTYTVLIRTLCPKDESKMSMQLLLGYIGGLNGLALLPVAIKMVFFDSCDVSGGAASLPDDSKAGVAGASMDSSLSASCENITLVVVAYLLGKAFFDNVLSDYLWARAVVLTSATVATVGLGLTIPLAFLSDWFMGHDDVVSLQSVTGAIAVLFGFIFVNCGETGDEEIAEES